MKKILSVLLSVCIIASLCVPMVSLADEAATPTPVFVEDFDNWNNPAASDTVGVTNWERNSTWYGSTDKWPDDKGFSMNYGDNYPSTDADSNFFTADYKNSFLDNDPVNSENKVLNTGKFTINGNGSFLMGRDLPDNCKNKIVEVWTYFGKDMPREIGEYNLKVGEIKISVNGWNSASYLSPDSPSGFNYCIQEFNHHPISWTKYPGESNAEIFVSDGWHQFVFDYSKDATGNLKPVDVYLNGTKILENVNVDSTKNSTLNRAEGNRIVTGDASGADGQRDYYLDNIRVWEKENLDYALSLAPVAPVATPDENGMLYEQTFDSGFGFNGWSWKSGDNRQAMTAAGKTASISAAPDANNNDNYVVASKDDSYSLVYSRLPGITTNKTIEVWFYDDPDTWKSDKDNGKLLNSGVYIGDRDANKNNLVSTSYFIGILHQTSFNEPRDLRYCFCLPGNSGTNGTAIERTKGWHQFVFDFSTSGEQKLYIDGTYIGGTTNSAPINCRDIWIGDNYLGVDGMTSGMYFDDVRVWNSKVAMDAAKGKVIVNDVDFVNNSGNKISVLKANDSVKADIKYYNNSKIPATQDFNLILAEYKNGAVENVVVGDKQSINIGWGPVRKFSPITAITLPSDLTGVKLRAFVFESMSGLKPLAEVTGLPN